MFAVELHSIIFQDAAQAQSQGRAAVGTASDFFVRGDSSTVVNRASVPCLEGFFQRIRNRPDATVRVPVRIVHNLDASAAWRVVFGDCEFELAVIADRPETLHQAFAISTGSHYRCPVQVLESTGNNLGRRC